MYSVLSTLCLCSSATKFARYLNIASSYRHKSWYVHRVLWVVPRQLFRYGDTWRYSATAIESRGARLKRFGRKCAS